MLSDGGTVFQSAQRLFPDPLGGHRSRLAGCRQGDGGGVGECKAGEHHGEPGCSSHTDPAACSRLGGP
eukprot:1435713-Prymnesium_polylepis.1